MKRKSHFLGHLGQGPLPGLELAASDQNISPDLCSTGIRRSIELRRLHNPDVIRRVMILYTLQSGSVTYSDTTLLGSLSKSGTRPDLWHLNLNPEPQIECEKTKFNLLDLLTLSALLP